MQRRIFTVHPTEAPTLTALAMKKPKTSQESSSVQLMCSVCIFSRELVSFSWKENLLTVVIPTMNQRIFCSNKGNLGCRQLHISALLPHLSPLPCLFCAFETIRTDLSVELGGCIMEYPANRDGSKALGPNGLAICAALGLGIISSVFRGVLQNNRSSYCPLTWWWRAWETQSRLYLRNETFWKLPCILKNACCSKLLEMLPVKSILSITEVQLS